MSGFRKKKKKKKKGGGLLYVSKEVSKRVSE